MPKPFFVPNPIFGVNIPRVAPEGVGSSPPNCQGTAMRVGIPSDKDTIILPSVYEMLLSSEQNVSNALFEYTPLE